MMRTDYGAFYDERVTTMIETRVTNLWVREVHQAVDAMNELIGNYIDKSEDWAVAAIRHFQIIQRERTWLYEPHEDPGFDVIVLCEVQNLD